MEFSESLKNNIEFMIDNISSCKTIDQLENCENMINFFCNINKENDRIPFAKCFLNGALAMKSKEILYLETNE